MLSTHSEVSNRMAMGLVKTYGYSTERVGDSKLTYLHGPDTLRLSARGFVSVSLKRASPQAYTICTLLMSPPSSYSPIISQVVLVVSAPHAIMAVWTVLLWSDFCWSLLGLARLRHLVHVRDRRSAWVVLDIRTPILLLPDISHLISL